MKKLLIISGVLFAIIVPITGCTPTTTTINPVVITSTYTVTPDPLTVTVVPAVTTVTTYVVPVSITTEISTLTVTQALTTSPPTTSAVNPDAKILISYSSNMTTQIGATTYPYNPQPGYVYLVLSLSIKNAGYDSVRVGSSFFGVVINNIQYNNTYVTELQNKLPNVTVLNDGSITGSIVFEIPAGNISFEPVYIYHDSYNVEWVKN